MRREAGSWTNATAARPPRFQEGFERERGVALEAPLRVDRPDPAQTADHRDVGEATPRVLPRAHVGREAVLGDGEHHVRPLPRLRALDAHPDDDARDVEIDLRLRAGGGVPDGGGGPGGVAPHELRPSVHHHLRRVGRVEPQRPHVVALPTGGACRGERVPSTRSGPSSPRARRAG